MIENPLSSEVRAELALMHNRIMEIEGELIRVMQHPLAANLREVRYLIFPTIEMMRQEEERLEGPF